MMEVNNNFIGFFPLQEKYPYKEGNQVGPFQVSVSEINDFYILKKPLIEFE